MYASFLLCLTATVCDKNIWNFDAILILSVEDLHGLDGFWNGLAAANEHAIDIKGIGVLVRY